MASGAEQTGGRETKGRQVAFIDKVFGQDDATNKGAAKARRRSDVAQVPATVLTVEYVDGSEGMESALRTLDERMGRVEKLLRSMQETNNELATLLNRQGKELSQFVEGINRRVDRIYGCVSAGKRGRAGGAVAGQEPESFGVPAEHEQDEAHQQAWRTARVMAADIDAYYPDMVREGVIYETFLELLKEPIDQARETYAQRVPAEVADKVDYLDLALKELIAKKQKELAEEEAADS